MKKLKTPQCMYCGGNNNSFRQILKIPIQEEGCEGCRCCRHSGSVVESLRRDSDLLFYTSASTPLYGHPSSFTARHSGRRSTGKNKKKKDLSVWRYLSDSLAKSSISGINNCAKSKFAICKFLWLAVFLFCGFGYSYQTFNFYNWYVSKPTVVLINVENDGQVEFPALTICNANSSMNTEKRRVLGVSLILIGLYFFNYRLDRFQMEVIRFGFRKKEFCRIFRDKCQGDVENLTVSESQMNDLVYELLLDDRGDDKKSLGHPPDMIESCAFQGYPTVSESECVSMLQQTYDPDLGNCYTIPAKNKDGLPLEAREGDFWQETNDMTFLVDVAPEEYMEQHRQVGIYLVVHDEGTLPDMHTDGLFLTPGHSYSIGVRKSSVLLLPLPYKINCTNYGKLPWQKSSNRRMTSRLCTVGCSQYFQLKDCNYVAENLSLFYEHLPYKRKAVTPEAIKCAKRTEEKTLDYCRSICGLPCSDTMFSTRSESSPISAKIISQYNLYHKEDKNRSMQDSMVHAKVFYASFEHKIYKHTPKYESMELFSFLGGYSGVWLGFSLLTVYEMMEILVSTFLIAIKKLRQKRRKSRFIRSVLESRGSSRLVLGQSRRHH